MHKQTSNLFAAGHWQPRQIPGSLLAEKHVFALRGVEGAFLLGKMKSETLWSLLFEVGQTCPLWVVSQAHDNDDGVPEPGDKPEGLELFIEPF